MDWLLFCKRVKQQPYALPTCVKLACFNGEKCAEVGETDRQIFSLYSKGYTQREIAEPLGYSNNGAVSKRIKHIKEKLAEVYGRYK